MSVNKNGNLRADGISVSLPTLFGRLGGTYYWNPGAPGAPPFTVTRSFGIPGFGAHWVHLRPGLSSKDTLGKGITGNVSVGIPSVSVNGATPDGWFSPGKAKEIAVEWGIGSPNASPALTKTYSPAQIADLINTYIFPPAMGPLDELSPFARTLQSGIARVAPSAEQPLPYMRAPSQGPLGAGVAPWASDYLKGQFGPPSAATASPGSGSSFAGRATPVPYLPDVSQNTPGGLPGLIASVTGSDPSDPAQFQPRAGGLLGMIQDYMRDNPVESGAR